MKPPSRKSGLPTADKINEAHRLAKASAETAVECAIECGRLLLARKDESKHGEFQAWIDENCKFSYSTAKLYMKAAHQKGNALAFSSLRGLFPSGKARPKKAQPKAPNHGVVIDASVEERPKKEAASVIESNPAINLNERWEPDEDEDAAHELMEKELDASVEKVMRADDKLAAAYAEIKRQAAEIATLKLRRDAYQNERVEAIQLCKKLQRENDRLKSQLSKKAA